MTDATAVPYKGRRYALTTLFAVYACYSLDKNVIAVLIEPIKADLLLTDGQAGALTGMAYAVAFVVAGPFVGVLLDRVSRTKALGMFLAVWSALTVACAFTTTHWQLLLARMGVGAAETGASPAAMSMIADLYPPKKRSSAIGLLYVSSGLGMCLTFLVGSQVAALWGWRQAFLLAGLPGLILAVLMIFTVREPVRGGSELDLHGQAPANASARALLNPALISAFAAMALSSLVLSSIVVWSTSFLVRSFDFDLRQAGLVVALTAGVCQGVGAVLGGQLASRLAGDSVWKLGLVPAVCLLASVPAGWMMAAAPNAAAAIVFMIITTTLASTFLGPGFAMVLALSPVNRRGLATSISQCLNNIIGFGLGPVLTGVLSDVFKGDDSLRPALGLSITINVLTGLAFVSAAWFARRAWLARGRG